MTWLASLAARMGIPFTELERLSLDGLQFWHRDVARLAFLGAIVLTILMLVRRMSRGSRAGRDGLVLPALFRRRGWDRGAWMRHAPFAPFAAGVPLLLLAIGDPYSPLVAEEVSYPGRRISLMIDASLSMTTSFTTDTLKTLSRTGPAFFTTVAAAERFVERRRAGRYRDLIALVEFGDQAYVITPFTSDYDNILLSISLLKDPVEFSRFPNRGTVISRALVQSLDLFKAFDFLDASGNLMVIFSDGEDTAALAEGLRLDDILESAIESKVPLYFVRTNYQKSMGDVIPDSAWKAAVEKTGGRFYAVGSEADLLQAIDDIDRVAEGTIRVRRYTSQQPQFARFALAAAVLWSVAAALKLAVPRFQQLP
jgi:hypothetical protein